jgi:hypothetical protein
MPFSCCSGAYTRCVAASTAKAMDHSRHRKILKLLIMIHLLLLNSAMKPLEHAA